MNINQEKYQSKSKILATLFNIFFPGSGYFYIGYFKKSLFFMLGLITLMYAFYYLTDYFKNAYIFLSIFPIAILIYAYTIFDVIKIISTKEDRHYKINKWYFTPLLIILISFLLAVTVEISPIRYFKIPSMSMSPTIQQGDHIIVKKEVRKILREEIIIFRYPKNPNTFLIKRCIAVSGDKVFMKNKTLYLQPYEGEEYIKKNYPIENTLTINNSLWVKNPYKQSIKAINNDEKIIDDGNYPPPLFNFNQITIPQDSYFVMGDNRDHSNDSRFFGYIKTKNIFGIFNGVICFNYKNLSRINLKIK
ncbi:signal peptidase I [Sulfurimonas sp.]|uniref:signal peptidase I n=1 Tax=Sulfurimonas sp. TaxID=2022749 RepID=UPI0025EE2DCA|nr:signal peptidase I [Sulfurimonas sp.]